jgi:hypothetical protein
MKEREYENVLTVYDMFIDLKYLFNSLQKSINKSHQNISLESSTRTHRPL